MCGIWCIINQEEKPFDFETFCTLGCANDRRGGDSCGIFIDGETEYGIGSNAYFENFFWDSKVLQHVKTATIALGHDRKASVGGISLEKAHPIIISEPIQNPKQGQPDKEVKFVLIHNGTIYNYEELAKKYIPDVDIKDMSDSQVIARLLYYSGYDWLAEYNGGAAFVAVDYREEEPRVILWRGESKKYSTSTQEEEERPLYCNYNNGRLVVSSIPSYLRICDHDCYIVPANEILEYSRGKLWIVQKIDRSKSQQNKKYEYVPTTNYSGHNNYVTGYLQAIKDTNSFEIKERPADGNVRVTIYGRVVTKYDSYTPVEQIHTVWFFNGVALVDKKAYTFICKAWQRSKLGLNVFTEKYQNLIRFFSYDRLYYKDKLMYEAYTPWDKRPYNGSHQMLTESARSYFVYGVKQSEHNGNLYESFEVLKTAKHFDYKTIWKEFIQSM